MKRALAAILRIKSFKDERLRCGHYILNICFGSDDPSTSQCLKPDPTAFKVTSHQLILNLIFFEFYLCVYLV